MLRLDNDRGIKGTGVTVGGELGITGDTLGWDLWKKFHLDFGFAETGVIEPGVSSDCFLEEVQELEKLKDGLGAGSMLGIEVLIGAGIGVTDLPTWLALRCATLPAPEAPGKLGLTPLLKTPREFEFDSITAGELSDLTISAGRLRFSTTSPPEITTGFSLSIK